MTDPRGPVRHLLFDADGVLQTLPGGWVEAVRPYVGDHAETFLGQAFEDERPALVGEDDLVPHLDKALGELGLDVTGEELYLAVWHRVQTVDEVLALVPRLRAAGYGVHLGTNQARRRGELMRTELGYDELFDVSCYSYDLGVAKPDVEYFRRCAQRIGADPAEILFVDDREDNVASAQSLGMTGVHWDHTLGTDALLAGLASYGVVPAL
ncbi:HAD family hydrolase [Lapillicoccus jejuensis]|uniref:Putative hydrolase of the HAD superfamily n=1 Tax=Lapillicoccus jejuensis TaxID=402171 RepID=A0A542E350_9MICO|nr:HAD-IA family hydrolase [Lapillicoccus jejuensis]TQJ09719.1 putative hydrolase of the HAD superfamily [Lapillicoccus jejuensis]